MLQTLFPPPAGKAFADTRKEQKGKGAVQNCAMLARDFLVVIAEAIKAADSAKGDDIFKALENIEYDGALGKIHVPCGAKKDPSKDDRDDAWRGLAGLGGAWRRRWPDPALTQYQE